MYAIIETGGKQYKVSPGDELRVEKLPGEVGETVRFAKVVAVSGDDGTLRTDGGDDAQVAATIAAHGRGPKIEVLKFKRRKMYRRRIGHRQAYTRVRIESIGAEPAEQAQEATAEQPEEIIAEQPEEGIAEQAQEQPQE